jgi:HEAT repeat protein
MFELDFSHFPHKSSEAWPKNFPQALVNPEKSVRIRALDDLAESSSAEKISVLVELLKHERDPDVYRQAKTLLLQLSEAAKAHSRWDPYGQFRI